MSARILITGATGILGKEVLRRFASMGLRVRAAVHRADHFPQRMRSEAIETVPFDFTDKSMIDNSLEGIETVLLITPSVSDLSEYVRIFLHRAKQTHVSHIVKVSFFGSQDAALFKVSRWHQAAEILIRESGIDFTIVRPNSYMQNFLSCMQPSGGLIYLPVGKGQVSFIDARDVALAVCEILVSPKKYSQKEYKLTGPQGLSFFKATAIISEVIGEHVEYVDISEETARHVMETMGIQNWLIDIYLELYALYRAGLASQVTHDYEHLTGSVTGTFVDFARDYADVLSKIVEHEEK